MNAGMGMTLRRAAVVAGLAGLAPLLFMGGVPVAEFYIFAKLIVPGESAETVRNILAHRGLFLVGVFAHLVTFVADVIIAWALYVLLAPVHRSLSLLTAWFRLVYTAVAIAALMHLVTAFRLIDDGAYEKAFGTEIFLAQVEMLIRSFRYEMSLGIAFFGIHVVLVGCLAMRSGYIPRLVGALVALAGLGYLLFYLRPYLYPNLDAGFLFITFFGELVFMIWLLVQGRKIPEPAG